MDSYAKYSKTPKRRFRVSLICNAIVTRVQCNLAVWQNNITFTREAENSVNINVLLRHRSNMKKKNTNSRGTHVVEILHSIIELFLTFEMLVQINIYNA